jgi:hypothetical protein
MAQQFYALTRLFVERKASTAQQDETFEKGSILCNIDQLKHERQRLEKKSNDSKEIVQNSIHRNLEGKQGSIQGKSFDVVGRQNVCMENHCVQEFLYLKFESLNQKES